MDHPVFNPHEVQWTAEKVSQFWDFYARNRHDDFFSEKHSHDLAKRVMRFHPRSVLDIGCGTGPFVATIARLGVDATGIDSSPAIIEVARSRSGAIPKPPSFFVGSIDAIPIRDSQVDVATLFEVVEHLDDQTLSGALAESFRVLIPGGRLLVSTPNGEVLRDGTVECPDCGGQFHTMQHVRSWTAESLESSLRSAGFSPVSVQSLRFVENGPMLETILRRVYYFARRQRPRLLAVAIRP
ncbi:MAG: methyltransferase domain-containing protein [Chloroflexota bacterium]|nr:MAG: methyltransferase domain-containing protein [Chloroflexota bacterium]